MKQLQKLGVVIISGILLLGCQGAGANAKAKPSKQSQEKAMPKAEATQFPDFIVKDFEDKEVALKDYRGKIIILDLFATWCPPCRKEIPHFVKLQDMYKDDLAVIGLSYDKTSVEKVKAFAEEMKINYAMFWGSEEIAAYVGLRGIPHTLVIDQQGSIIQSYVGYRDIAVFERDIKQLLKTKELPDEAPATK
jgi:thiol-disulfide isomerase/thioredoxin